MVYDSTTLKYSYESKLLRWYKVGETTEHQVSRFTRIDIQAKLKLTILFSLAYGLYTFLSIGASHIFNLASKLVTILQSQ